MAVKKRLTKELLTLLMLGITFVGNALWCRAISAPPMNLPFIETPETNSMSLIGTQCVCFLMFICHMMSQVSKRKIPKSPANKERLVVARRM
jgi:hypothetical protein